MSVLDDIEKTGEGSDCLLEEIVTGVVDQGGTMDAVDQGGTTDAVDQGGTTDAVDWATDVVDQEISAIRRSVVILEIDPESNLKSSHLTQEREAEALASYDLLSIDVFFEEWEARRLVSLNNLPLQDVPLKREENKEIEREISPSELPSVSPSELPSVSDCPLHKGIADRSFGEADVFFDRATGHSVPSFKEQFKEIGAVYANIVDHPSEFFKGMGECVKDYVKFFKSFFAKVTFESKEEELKFKTSQALGISEIVGKGVSIGSVSFLASLGIKDVLSAPAVFACSNYIACVATFIFTYVLSSRKKYGDWRLAYNDGMKIEAATIPATVVLYSTEIISISGLIALGLSATAASVVATIWGLVFYTGFMRAATKRTLSSN